MSNAEEFGANQGFIEDLYAAYLSDKTKVEPQWRELFRRWEAEGRPAQAPAAAPAPAPRPELDEATKKVQAEIQASTTRPVVPATADNVRSDLPPAPRGAAQPPMTAYAVKYKLAPSEKREGEDRVTKIRGAAATIVKNMDASLDIPVATSVRAIPCKVMFDNRIVVNDYLASTRGGKISFTHLIGYAMVEALVEIPEMNNALTETEDGKPALKEPAHVNLGIAIDVPKPDGTRSLVVPSIKGAESMTFQQFLAAYEDLVARGRVGKLTIDDFMGTTVSLTNPGGIGTVHSIPRLMKGQGTIIGVGSMTYPAEFAGATDKALNRMGISKVVTLTSTYDHRIIQGATSGEFLRLLERKLLGLDGFYERVFLSLQVPYEPIVWKRDVEYDHEREMGKPARIAELIHAYRSRGHLIADTDPLAFHQANHPDLQLDRYGLTLWDLDRSFPTGGFAGTSHLTLRQILKQLRDSYCRTIGIEYMHIQDPAQRAWFQAHIERPHHVFTPEEQQQILKKLNEAEAFETFLQTKYVGQKRFSLEGGESLIPALDTILEGAAHDGLAEVAIAMAHRGRLNVLTNIAGKSYKQVFTEFDGFQDPRSVQGSGDVKYHLGTEGVYTAPNGDRTDVYLAANPSHLEAADGVLEGIVRAKQDRMDLGDGGYQVLPILIHGDAAFAGQGVVMETLNLSQLSGYRTGGTLHIIVNNQIGFTTAPSNSRSSHYPTDIAKGLQVPIFHVNGDDPEAVVAMARLAYQYREEFHKDVILDIVCYRRRGHNEGDDPSMTQPVMYSLVDRQKTTRTLYKEALLGRGELTVETAQKVEDDYQAVLNSAFTQVREAEEAAARGDENAVAGLELPLAQQEDAGTMVGWQTAISPDILHRIGEAHHNPPEGFTLHPKIAQLFERRAKMVFDGGIDWGMGELIAFGSLLIEGTPVRMSGQDSRRGTFVQRHATVHDNTTGAEWTPLRHLTDDQAKLWIYDSALSEYSVMAYEYGYSVERPDALVLWEAQFGDFANGAQTVIDEFISSAEQKWAQRSSLVLLLPHGYEGQGPDHSSARIERYLQLCAQDNMIVAQPSTPANHFHLLRRQAYNRPRKPLVLFAPKQLLRRKGCVSGVEDFLQGTFQPVLGDGEVGQARRVLMCSGRVYYDLVEARAKGGHNDVAIVRIEQYYPNPTAELKAVLDQYQGAELVWVQDEPENQGAWTFLAMSMFRELGLNVRVVSRPASAAPSTGLAKMHKAENEDLMFRAFN